jgi:hypothetical protein
VFEAVPIQSRLRSDLGILAIGADYPARLQSASIAYNAIVPELNISCAPSQFGSGPFCRADQRAVQSSSPNGNARTVRETGSNAGAPIEKTNSAETESHTRGQRDTKLL